MDSETGGAPTDLRVTKMANVASQIKTIRTEEEPKSSISPGRRFVALIGQGTGPRIPIRTEKVCVRIRGLTVGGQLVLTIDDEVHKFQVDGNYDVLGGEFAMARSNNEAPVICELIVRNS